MLHLEGTEHPSCAVRILHALHIYLFSGLLNIPGNRCCFSHMSAQLIIGQKVRRARASFELCQPAHYSDACNTGEDSGSEAHMVAQHLLLDFLADRHQQKDAVLSSSARTFLTCRLFADELTSLRAAAALTQQQQAQLLVKYQNTSEQLEKGLVCDLNTGRLASNNVCSFA